MTHTFGNSGWIHFYMKPITFSLNLTCYRCTYIFIFLKRKIPISKCNSSVILRNIPFSNVIMKKKACWVVLFKMFTDGFCRAITHPCAISVRLTVLLVMGRKLLVHPANTRLLYVAYFEQREEVRTWHLSNCFLEVTN